MLIREKDFRNHNKSLKVKATRNCMDPLLEPFAMSLIAGSSTVIGGIIVLMFKRISNRIVSFSLGFASGVMLLVSFNDLFLEAVGLLTHVELMIMFSLGAIVMIALDLILPHVEPATKVGSEESSKIMRKGMLIALGITLHNFPEGVVVAAGYAYLPGLGLIIAIAIMLHNIPEGLAMAIPLRMGNVKPSKVVALTLLSGLTEPVAALITAIAFSFMKTTGVIGSSLAFAAGVMTYITADELIPVAHEYGYKHTVSIGLLLGIMFALLVDTLLS